MRSRDQVSRSPMLAHHLGGPLGMKSAGLAEHRPITDHCVRGNNMGGGYALQYKLNWPERRSAPLAWSSSSSLGGAGWNIMAEARPRQYLEKKAQDQSYL